MRERLDRVRRKLTRTPIASPLVLPQASVTARTLAVCHPEWRGVRTATYAFGDPVVETADPGAHADSILQHAARTGTDTLIVHAFPAGADTLLRKASEAGLKTRAVVHSSMAQHGAEKWESAVLDLLVLLAREGVIDGLGFVKAGMAEVFAGLGVASHYTPNRAPVIDPIDPLDLGDGLHIGVFASPFWRKNVVTQLGAVSLIDGATAHVMSRPDVGYLIDIPTVEHGELPWSDFVRLQGSVDLNLYVSLSECHPLSPVESFLAGVPCLISRTSALFRDEPDLWDLVSVSQADDPTAIAEAARRLIGEEGVVDMARSWIRRADSEAKQRWAVFVS